MEQLTEARKFNANCPQLVRDGRLKKLTSGARAGSTVDKVFGSGEPEATARGFPGVAVAPIYVVLVA